MELFMYIIFFVLAVLVVRELIPDSVKHPKKRVDIRELNIGIGIANERLRQRRILKELRK